MNYYYYFYFYNYYLYYFLLWNYFNYKYYHYIITTAIIHSLLLQLSLSSLPIHDIFYSCFISTSSSSYHIIILPSYRYPNLSMDLFVLFFAFSVLQFHTIYIIIIITVFIIIITINSMLVIKIHLCITI